MEQELEMWRLEAEQELEMWRLEVEQELVMSYAEEDLTLKPKKNKIHSIKCSVSTHPSSSVFLGHIHFNRSRPMNFILRRCGNLDVIVTPEII